MKANWTIQPEAGADFFDQFPEIDNTILQLLHNRGITDAAAIEQFLSPDYTRDVYDPFLFRNMRKAIERVWDAIDGGEKILLYGDYDADGVCSTALVAHFLKEQGVDDFEVILPHRATEGYGLSDKTVPRIIEINPDVVITLDCGSTNVAEVQALNDANCDVIILDHHHEPEEHPPAFALLNCSFADETYPTKNLAAGGMAFKFVQAMIMHAEETRQTWDKPPGYEKWYLDLAAIATVADMVPLIGENRSLVKFGLVVLNKTKRPGLRALIAASGLRPGEITERHIGFALGPRINAAGRIKHSMNAYDLLITDNPVEAQEKAAALQDDNTERQTLTREYVKAATEQIKPQLKAGAKVLFAFDPEWEIGLVGLVAGRLLDAYNRPVIVMSEIDGVVKGSGRSVKTFHITEALESMQEFFTHYGGHAQACGFTLAESNKRADFEKALQELAAKKVQERDLEQHVMIDLSLPLSKITWDVYEDLALFAPFGQEAHKPVFVSEGVLVQAVDAVGTDNQHVRITVSDDKGVSRKTIAFGFGEWKDKLSYGDFIDIVYDVDVNEWNGTRELQLKIIDIHKSEKIHEE